MTSEMIGGIVRAILASLGGYAVAKGVIDAGMWTAVSGALVTLFTAGWSLWSKAGK